MRTAISKTIHDGDCLYLSGFTHLIPFAAGHEIIRQGFEDLTLARATPDLVYDRMIAAGCVKKVLFSWAGNPGVGSLHAFRRAVEDGVPNEIRTEEYTHSATAARLRAGAHGLPFLPVRTFEGSTLPEHNDTIRKIDNPYGDDRIYVVPPLEPDVSVVRAQRADREGNAHLWGITGEIPDAAYAADRVVLAVEELVDESVIASDPNRTRIPGHLVDYVVEEPYGAHPSYAQGYYNRDNEAYQAWENASATHERLLEWLDEWVYAVDDHTEYLEKLGVGRLQSLEPEATYTAPANVGAYTGGTTHD
ncbi:CoA transferase subunit A [Natrarchaeobius chitinivorans]|uniref:CoA transferase subunit A n=1 Tax=Natrarchaeobius chitinivorans TaxID=1679083 RepID=A0A3N6M4M0_NATCH|nr:CoA-transferase [Natrarchaeobius chitinivorans]RQG95444.1 CoA transferase subunit A [Natrarchaeobius chitinivorans]